MAAIFGRGEIVGTITSIDANMPHDVSEVICIRCGKRWISVRPYTVLLKDIECPNCGAGFVIETGQDMEAMEP